MGKNAWFVVSDLHLYYKNISSRVDYVGEMRKVRDDLIAIATKYRDRGYRANLLLLGDVFHRSYRNTFLSSYDNNFFILWKRTLGDVYSVVGNHELHYYSSNPFFTLVNKIESEKVRGVTSGMWTPQGLFSTIRIVDRLEDGEVVFHFNHFGTPVSKAEPDKVNVGLFHQEIVNDEIVSMMQQQLGHSIWADTISFDNLRVFDGYSYCFMGHLHQVYGAFKSDSGTVIYYLGSLGRTTSAEVNDSFLERCIPAVIVEDGVFKQVEECSLMLPSRKECLREVEVVEGQHQYVVNKARKEARRYDVQCDNPMDGLLRYFGDNQACTDIVKELLKNPVDSISAGLRFRFNQMIGGI